MSSRTQQLTERPFASDGAIPKRDANAGSLAIMDRINRRLRLNSWLLAIVGVEYIVLIVVPQWIEILR